MKDIKFIIEKHVYQNPLYEKLNKIRQYQELISMMSETHKQFISFCYVKDKTLFIVLKNPILLRELRYDNNIKMIKGLLKTIVQIRPESVFASVTDIKIFVTNKIQLQNSLVINYNQHIKTPPKSKGEFKNLAKNQEIYIHFEEIRKIIKGKL
ncbi:hypothetical protein [Campylobacter pinnipediorum]|uniref:hypothetical protein n=1 Tax=Campylobacter pinnipediorum TaxID=1965231 RepID=UPI000994D0F6|nr:hypothetical protein [Campylobacter pinnipediorum]AQW82583.1 hypothetical protein CPIN17261_0565 [Campylobacter pinnipediorum subsp. pinnipediorum]